MRIVRIFLHESPRGIEEVPVSLGVKLDRVFSGRRYGAVIHFAGLKAVGESVSMPLKYHDVNVGGTLRLLESMSAHGVDCSGLTSRVYWANGVELRRDADMQFDDPGARPVERAALAPGDLVFFGEKKVTHVGMYVGEGRFISATTHVHPDVHEESLDDPYWVALFRGARRPR